MTKLYFVAKEVLKALFNERRFWLLFIDLRRSSQETAGREINARLGRHHRGT